MVGITFQLRQKRKSRSILLRPLRVRCWPKGPKDICAIWSHLDAGNEGSLLAYTSQDICP